MTDLEAEVAEKYPHIAALAEPNAHPGRGHYQLAALLISISVLVAVFGLVARSLDDRSTIHQLHEQSACRSALATGVDIAIADALLALIDREPGESIDPERIRAIADELRSARTDRASTPSLC